MNCTAVLKLPIKPVRIKREMDGQVLTAPTAKVRSENEVRNSSDRMIKESVRFAGTVCLLCNKDKSDFYNGLARLPRNNCSARLPRAKLA